jgi:hypothetical protein
MGPFTVYAALYNELYETKIALKHLLFLPLLETKPEL